MGLEIGDVLTFVSDAAFLRSVESVDAVHHDGLACAVWADNGVDLPLFHVEIDAGEGGNPAEVHVNVLKFQDGLPPRSLMA